MWDKITGVNWWPCWQEDNGKGACWTVDRTGSCFRPQVMQGPFIIFFSSFPLPLPYMSQFTQLYNFNVKHYNTLTFLCLIYFAKVNVFEICLKMYKVFDCEMVFDHWVILCRVVMLWYTIGLYHSITYLAGHCHNHACDLYSYSTFQNLVKRKI